MKRLEHIRAAATVKMGLAKSWEEATQKVQSVPKVAFVSPPTDYKMGSVMISGAEIDVVVRMLSMGIPHGAIPITGAVGTAGAARVEGTVHNEAGLGLPAIRIRLFDASTGDFLFRTTTDDSGAFSLAGLTAGTWRLTLTATGSGTRWYCAMTSPAYIAELSRLTIRPPRHDCTVLAAMIPLVYGYSHLHHHGTWSSFHFDGPQQLEILLTLLQTGLAMLLLANMEFDWLDASIIFVLWLAQFLVPHWRDEVAIAYGIWMVILVGQYAVGDKKLLAWRYFLESVRERGTGKGEG